MSSNGYNNKLVISYNVIGTDANGCKDTAHIPLTVYPLPIMSMTPVNSAIYVGDTANLSVSGAATYSWTPTSIISPTTGANISVFPTNTTVYTVLGTDTNGCQDTVMTTVSVNPLPIVNITPSQDTICVQDSIQLTATGGILYQWTPASSLSTSIGNTVTAGPIATTSYIVSVSDINNCVNTDTAIITVLPQPVVVVSAASSGICFNDSTIITASGANSYNWYPNTNINTTTGTPVSVFPSSSTIYNVIGTDANGCTDTAHIPITVNALPIVSVNSTSNGICIGDSCNISASGASYYTWTPIVGINPNTGQNINCFANTTTTYTVIGTDTNGCSNSSSVLINVYSLPNVSISPLTDTICDQDTILLTATGGVNYQWSPSSSLSSITGSVNSAFPSVSTVYTVTATDFHNCSNTANASIFVMPLPNIQINPKNTGICSGDSVQLMMYSNQNIISYLWSSGQTYNPIIVNPDSTTIYIGTGIDNYGCENSDTSTVIVTEVPTVELFATSPICNNDTSCLTFSTSASLPYQIVINYDGGNLCSGFGTGPYLINWPTPSIKNVRLTVIKDNCPSVEESAIVIVNPNPVPNFVADSFSTCEDVVLQIFNLSGDSSLNSFWNFGDPNSTNNTSTLYGPSHTYSNSGFYTVTLVVENVFGCKDSLSKPSQLQIYSNPIADFDYSPDEISIDNPVVNFSDLSDIGDYWNWNFGDTLTGSFNFSNDQNPYHIYIDTGYYYVCMNVITDKGCSDTICKLIDVGYPPTLYVPNAFTPNSDNVNDIFIPKGYGYDWNTYEMYIFNRWGDVVFMTRNIYQGWDGRDKRNSKVCPSDVYTCLILVRDFKGRQIKRVESIVLYR